MNQKIAVLFLSIVTLLSSNIVFGDPDLGIPASKISEYSRRLREKGQLAPFPELKPIVRDLEAKLESPELLQLAAINPAVEHLRQMVLTSFFHVDLKFRVQAPNYPYDIPFEAPFPYRPTAEAISEALEFFDVVKKATGLDMGVVSEIDPTKPNWFSFITRAKSRATIDSRTTEVDPVDGLTAEKRIVENPTGEYTKFLKRIEAQGENVSFPEFKAIADKMDAELSTNETLDAVKQNPVLEQLHARVVRSLLQIKLEAPNDSLVFKPFNEAYPYRPTIRAIYDAIRFFDVVERLKYKEHPDSQVVERSWMQQKSEQDRLVEPLYHFDRYKYHWFTLIADPKVIIFPTSAPLGFRDLIRVRSVPIGFVGVQTKTSRVDRHFQTPLDFWYHDVNHVRRMVGYMYRKLKDRGAVTDQQKLEVYKEMDAMIEKIVERVELSPKPKPPEKLVNSDEQRRFEHSVAVWKKEMALRKLVRVIVFEIVHESALAADRESIVGDLMRTPNTPQPFEYQSLDDIGVTDIEQRRTDSGNLVSGARKMRKFKGDSPTYIMYINDRALSLLSNVMNKVLHGFYDSVYDPKSYVVPVEYRTPEHVAEAAELAFNILGAKAPAREILLGWITSRTGSPEKYTKYEGLKVPLSGAAKSCSALFRTGD